MITWTPVAFFRIAAIFLLGIVLGNYFPHFTNWHLVFLTLLMILYGVVFYTCQRHQLYRITTGILGLSFFLLSGYIHIQLYKDLVHQTPSKNLSTSNSLLISIEDPLVEKPKSWKSTAKILASVQNGHWAPEKGSIVIYLEKSSARSSYKEGDVLFTSAKAKTIAPPQNPDEFDYKAFMGYRGIGQQLYLPKDATKLVGSTPLPWWKKMSIPIRNWCQDQLTTHIQNTRERKILSALSLGIRSSLDNDIRNAYAASGAMHVLAVSGLHVGILFLFLNFILGPIKKIKYGHFLHAFLILFALWFYAILTGLPPSIQRATLMFSIIALGKLFGRSSNIYNSLGIAALIMMLLNPFIIMEVGFQLSFLAVLGIVFIFPKLEGLWKPRWKVVKYIWQISCVSFAAQLATFPLGLLYYHQFPNLFLVSNLVVIPAAFLIFIGCLLLFTFSWWTYASAIIGSMIEKLTQLLNDIIFAIESFPHALSSGITISTAMAWCIYSIILGAMGFWYQKRMKLLYLSATGAFLFCSLQFLEQTNQENEFIVYATKKASAYDFVSGNQHWFIADSSLTESPEQMRFHILHHWWAHHLEEQSLSWSTAVTLPHKDYPGNTHLTYFEGKSFLFTDTPELFADQKVDFLIISSHNGKPYIPSSIQADHVIFDGTIPSWWEPAFRKYSAAYQEKCHFVNSEGAYIFSL